MLRLSSKGVRKSLSSLKNLKAAGLLEYALVALISVAVFGILFYLFGDFANELFDRIMEAVNGTE
ncbi:MAG: hypothetical protein ACKOW9_05370 [Candidatus Paceibacterota bacterium]